MFLPPTPHAVATADERIKIKAWNNSKGCNGKNPLCMHFLVFLLQE